ncbi:MAG: hypothetical protein FKY71_20035 [Spiribacter salinus]|uniref:Uncharacterized protein n=1 Tax=Spiribacter salinus TaxID=1335746 RepID=A0A540V5R1_9GAMM|nr:MAG: hypothetical protein FKY71_20035 [Spiribacter salinus]
MISPELQAKMNDVQEMREELAYHTERRQKQLFFTRWSTHPPAYRLAAYCLYYGYAGQLAKYRRLGKTSDTIARAVAETCPPERKPMETLAQTNECLNTR